MIGGDLKIKEMGNYLTAQKVRGFLKDTHRDKLNDTPNVGLILNIFTWTIEVRNTQNQNNSTNSLTL